ncbi:hypothetical protein CDD81_7296 [Ophiocordyceps australis]|uniref:Cytochrome P450 n=1 Tax=Ophiocordyceps australis TaxID=1399860 RepID=A0A2C5Y3H9_9HYPO|nr:hypothetical protein CDD81_7296 [Ophiocordyceps australis]
MMLLVYTVVLVAVVAALYKPWAKPLPPGPRGLPIIGNAHQLATKYPWKQLQQWHKAYGPLIAVRAGPQTLIVLGNYQTAHELLVKRSTIYSSRPRLVVLQECLLKGRGAAMMPHGPRWKQNHKMQASLLTPRRCQLYQPLQELESRQLLYNLLSSNDFDHEFARFSSSLVSTLLYGKRFDTGREDELAEIEELSSEFIGQVSFGSWAVDMFPLLNVLPRSLAKWKRVGDAFYERQTHLFQKQTAYALSRHLWNWTRECLDKEQAPRLDVLYTLGELFEAASHTTAGVLCVAVLASVSHPDAVRRVQQELDAVVGPLRLPGFKDVPRLAYTRAFAQEVLRWRPLVPTGIPHCATADDEYHGFRIPRGAAIVANQWSIDMDADVFARPEQFEPQRWLDASSSPPLPQGAFGYGRRMCPGQHLAQNSLVLVVARMLWAFGVAWKQGDETNAAEVEMTHEGAFSKPKGVRVVFSVRSEGHERVVRRGWEQEATSVDDVLREIGAAVRAEE